jgi:hypothetical protein
MVIAMRDRARDRGPMMRHWRKTMQRLLVENVKSIYV